MTVCVSEYNLSIRTELQLHQLPETNTFGIVHPTKVRKELNNHIHACSRPPLADRERITIRPDDVSILAKMLKLALYVEDLVADLIFLRHAETVFWAVHRWRRSSERPSPSPSCWLPWKPLASQPPSRRQYGMFLLPFTIWELPGPAEVTLIHHPRS